MFVYIMAETISNARENNSNTPKIPPIPANDSERVSALLEYRILDTLPEKEYDDITLIATQICETPISSIGFIDKTRQVLKSNRGLTDVVPREDSICTHTINASPEMLIVPDLRNDVRFADHPAVAESPNLAFYAGISLINPDGFALGTLCVIDHKPRKLTEDQIILLRALANQVMKLLELRKINMQLETLSNELRDQAIELQQANAELETFNYTVSHDLQSPLRSITGFSKLLLKNHTDKLNADGVEFLTLINGSASRMSSLVHDLLRFSKLGKGSLEIQQVDIYTLVCETLNEIKASATGFKAEVSVQPVSKVYCDPGLMRQVWQNLIGNAVKYSSKKEKPVIEIGCREINSEPVYYIKDNGAGFDSIYASKLFNAFQRLHGQEEFEGTGVGLATVHRIITKHGGRIWAEADIDKGATFYFTLPQV